MAVIDAVLPTHVSKRLAKSQLMMSGAAELLRTAAAPTNRRAIVCAAALDRTLQYHRSLGLLVGHSLFAGAQSLLHPCWRSCVLGIWLHQCATEIELDRFQRRVPKDIRSMVHRIDRLRGFNHRVLSGAFRASWETLKRLSDDEWSQIPGKPSEAASQLTYGEVELLRLIGYADAIALVAAVQRIHLTHGVEAANKALIKASASFTSAVGPASAIEESRGLLGLWAGSKAPR